MGRVTIVTAIRAVIAGGARVATIVAVSLSCAGCFGQHRDWTDDLVWSPDGSRAAMLSRGALYITDSDGRLSPQLALDVSRVAWMGDGESLVIAQSHTVTTFSEIAAAIGPERVRAIAARAERLWQHIQASSSPKDIEDILDPHGLMDHRDAGGLFPYLFDTRPEALLAILEQLEPDADATSSSPEDISLYRLVRGRVSGERFTAVATLAEELTPIRDLRVAPNDRLVGYTIEDEGLIADHTVRALVAPADASAPPVLVGEDTAEFSEWTADSRAIVFIEIVGGEIGSGSLGAIGCLASRSVAIAAATPRIALGETSCLVDVFVQKSDRVRALHDGRLVFNSVEAHLPQAHIATGDDQLFVLDPETESEPIRILPADQAAAEVLVFFDVSPDGRRILYGSSNGHIRQWSATDARTVLLRLDFGRPAEEVRAAGRLAIWSGPDAITFLKRIGERDEVVLLRDQRETVLSRGWPDSIRTPLILALHEHLGADGLRRELSGGAP